MLSGLLRRDLLTIAPKIHRTFAVPILVFAMEKTSEAITAPTFPPVTQGDQYIVRI